MGLKILIMQLSKTASFIPKSFRYQGTAIVIYSKKALPWRVSALRGRALDRCSLSNQAADLWRSPNPTLLRTGPKKKLAAGSEWLQEKEFDVTWTNETGFSKLDEIVEHWVQLQLVSWWIDHNQGNQHVSMLWRIASPQTMNVFGKGIPDRANQ